MNKLAYTGLKLIAVCAAIAGSASGQQLVPAGVPRSSPFTATLSNNTPLVFGMDAADASRALGQPLNYISGRPGDEIYLAFRNIGGSGLFNHHDRLYLQFRSGRLAGWKGDWGHNWMWHRQRKASRAPRYTPGRSTPEQKDDPWEKTSN